MKIVLISALGKEVLKECINSLLETFPLDNDLLIIKEKAAREDSLNAAFKSIGKKDDILFVGDDIIFTPGWYGAFMKNYRVADILGLTTLYPGTDRIQDNGYDLVQVDNMITLEAKNRNKRISEIKLSEYRMCDAVCGCLMFIKKGVFELVPAFSRAGKNRWSEFIFAHLAKRKKAKVAVLSHCVYHGGVSTKTNPIKELSSISYQLEKKFWKPILDKYVDKKMIEIKYKRSLTVNLLEVLNSSQKILLYGAGTVTEFLLKYLQNKKITICSGLPEEYGKVFHGHKIIDYKKALKEAYDLIVMTTLLIGESIYKNNISPIYNNEANTKVVEIILNIKDNNYIYGLKEII